MARIQLGECNDPRPVVIVDFFPNETVGYFPISTKCYESSCFYIDRDHVNFSATGLPRSSYVLDGQIYTVKKDSLFRMMGSLTGELLEQFKKYAGF